MKAGSALGLVALLTSFAAITVPFPLSYWVLWGSLLMAGIGFLVSDRGLSLAAFLLCGVGLVFFSPVTLGFLFMKNNGHIGPWAVITITMFALPMVALIFNISTKRKQQETGSN